MYDAAGVYDGLDRISFATPESAHTHAKRLRGFPPLQESPTRFGK
jgi:hypothetical protein